MTTDHNTPFNILKLVYQLLGTVDLDPCSDDVKYPNVLANIHYTIHNDGLKHVWKGKVYMNPPFGDVNGKWTDVTKWISKLNDEYISGNIIEAITLLPSYTDTMWWHILNSYPRCFIKGRLTFGNAGQNALFPSMIVYLGKRIKQFAAVFGEIGAIFVPFK